MPVPVSGPWGAQPWTYDVGGEPCASACTQQFSDRGDGDDDGNWHNGHPKCETALGEAYCGPCQCGAGEAQSYVMTSLYPHTPSLPLISCTPCESGRFKLGNETLMDECEVCSAGFFSEEGATACSACPVGSVFVSSDIGCRDCSAGMYATLSMTACAPCEMGSFQGTSGQSVCLRCTDAMVCDVERRSVDNHEERR